MKKILSLLVVFALTATLLVTTAFAAGTTVSVDKKDAQPGDEVTIDVAITGNTGIGAAKVKLSYDSTYLTLTSVQAGTVLPNPTLNTTKGILTFASATNVAGDGVLMTATFKVAETAPNGEYPVTVEIDKMISEDSVSLAPAIVAGSITVNVPHTHSYSAPVFTWNADNTCSVSYSCTDCGEPFSTAATVTSQADTGSCTVPGKVTYTAAVVINGQNYTDTKVVTGETLPHNYKATFTWAEDLSSVSVVLVCQDCNASVEVDAADVVITEKTTPATEKKEGKIVYTATVVVDGQTYTDVQTVVLPKLEGDKAPETGDGMQIAFYMTAMLVAAAAALLALKKRENV